MATVMMLLKENYTFTQGFEELSDSAAEHLSNRDLQRTEEGESMDEIACLLEWVRGKTAKSSEACCARRHSYGTFKYSQKCGFQISAFQLVLQGNGK